MAVQPEIEIRTCITCGSRFAYECVGLADHSQCYDCEEADAAAAFYNEDEEW